MSSDETDKPERRLTDGARDLRAYLTSHALSITAFCEQNGLDRIQVQRVLNGERWKRITVDFADSIARATKGEVPLTSWKSTTAPSESGRLPEDTGEHPVVESDPATSTGTG